MVKIRFEHLLGSVMLCLVMAFLMMLLIHTTVLHAWANMSAELLRFADKEFYSVCICVPLYCPSLQCVISPIPRTGGRVPPILPITAGGTWWSMTHSYIYQDMKMVSQLAELTQLLLYVWHSFSACMSHSSNVPFFICLACS